VRFGSRRSILTSFGSREFRLCRLDLAHSNDEQTFFNNIRSCVVLYFGSDRRMSSVRGVLFDCWQARVVGGIFFALLTLIEFSERIVGIDKAMSPTW